MFLWFLCQQILEETIPQSPPHQILFTLDAAKLIWCCHWAQPNQKRASYTSDFALCLSPLTPPCRHGPTWRHGDHSLRWVSWCQGGVVVEGSESLSGEAWGSWGYFFYHQRVKQPVMNNKSRIVRLCLCPRSICWLRIVVNIVSCAPFWGQSVADMDTSWHFQVVHLHLYFSFSFTVCFWHFGFTVERNLMSPAFSINDFNEQVSVTVTTLFWPCSFFASDQDETTMLPLTGFPIKGTYQIIPNSNCHF